jgi:DNA-binding transcriptional ArsR family regulator
VYSLDWFAFDELRRTFKGVDQRFVVVYIHPYSKEDLHDLWTTYHANVAAEENVLQEAIRHAFGNPHLLHELAQVVHAENARLGNQTASERSVKRILDREGFSTARKLADDYSLDGTQHRILVKVCQHGPVTATQLAREYDLDRSLCSYHLSQLKKAGLVHALRRGGPQVFYEAVTPVKVVVETHGVAGYE